MGSSEINIFVFFLIILYYLALQTPYSAEMSNDTVVFQSHRSDSPRAVFVFNILKLIYIFFFM